VNVPGGKSLAACRDRGERASRRSWFGPFRHSGRYLWIPWRTIATMAASPSARSSALGASIGTSKQKGASPSGPKTGNVIARKIHIPGVHIQSGQM